jgi:cystathionine gamma-lyase
MGTRGIECTFTAMNKPEDLRSLFKSNTKMVWIETPTNPTLAVVDIAAVSQLAHSIRADILVVTDNTFMTPYLQRPLTLGADIVTHSASKYLNGHCDVIMGLTATKDDALYERLVFLQNAIGAVPSPFDCYMTMRGLRTLHVRMDRHCANAMKVATFLTTHSAVEQVYYPGLPSHPSHAVSVRQASGHGGIVSFRVHGGLPVVCKFSAACKVFTLAESLGGVESLVDVPAVMTHGAVAAEERAELGITDGFIRLSVGIEDIEDLISDLKQALDAAAH